MKQITKEQFLSVYDKYPPKKWIEFVYKYFHTDWSIGMIVAVSFFALATILGAFGLTKMSAILYIPFFAIIPITLPAYLLNQKRIKKIIKELGIDFYEYNIYVTLYL